VRDEATADAVLIRFGDLRVERNGHFAVETDLYLCHLDSELTPQRRFDLFGSPKSVCNQHLRLMWARTFMLIPCWLLDILDKSCLFWARGKLHHIDISLSGFNLSSLLNT